LENAVERSMILAQSGPLRFDLPESSVAVKAPSSKAAAEVLPRSRAELKQQERAMIEDALRECRGRIFGPSGAAAQLGMRPTTLASRIKTLGIQRKR
jgi:DNA-binding NtrC family response regulator